MNLNTGITTTPGAPLVWRELAQYNTHQPLWPPEGRRQQDDIRWQQHGDKITQINSYGAGSSAYKRHFVLIVHKYPNHRGGDK